MNNGNFGSHVYVAVFVVAIVCVILLILGVIHT